MASTASRVTQISIAAVAMIATGGAAAHAGSSGADALGCDETVHDPEGILDRGELDPVISSTASLLDADVRVRVEGTLDGGLDRRIDQLREQCPGWASGDELADDMVVVLFSAVERENSIFYGADLGPMLEDRWDAATDAMIPYLRDGDYTEAVAAGLRGLERDPAGSSSSSRDASASSDGGDGLPGEVVIWIVVLVAIVGFSALARQMGWTSGGNQGDTDDSSTGWFGGSSRRRSFGSSFRSRGSSGFRSSRGGGSRRAGGGTKKW